MRGRALPIRERPIDFGLAAVLALVARIIRESQPSRNGVALVDAHDLDALDSAYRTYLDALAKEPAPSEEICE